MQAIKILKEQQLIGIDNFYHIKRFLERFTKKVLAFIATNDQDIMLMKNKVSRDLLANERQNDDKIKALRNMLHEVTGEMNQQSEVTFEVIKQKQKEMDNKLQLVETSEVLIDFFKTQIRSTKLDLAQRIDEESKQINDRVDKLILEELTHEKGLFGK